MSIKYPDNYVVYDTETTGLDVLVDQPIEIAAIRYFQGKEESRRSWLIKSAQPISPKITEITGITNELLDKEGGDLARSIEEFFRFTNNMVLVGHNISRYDNPLIEKYPLPPYAIFRPEGCYKVKDWVDTAALFKASLIGETQHWHENHQQFAKRVLEKICQGKFNLVKAYVELGGEVGRFQAHRAIGDCEMTNFVYQRLSGLLLMIEPSKATEEVVLPLSNQSQNKEVIAFDKDLQRAIAEQQIKEQSQPKEPEIVRPHPDSSYHF